MDVTRLVEEIKDKLGGLELANEEVYMNSIFEDFVNAVILKYRGGGKKDELKYSKVCDGKIHN